MHIGDPKNSEGVTLLELTLAMAIFAVVIGVTAQSLVTFYARMDLQEQRTTAINVCRSVLNDMRSLRDSSSEEFHDALLEAFPEGMEISAESGWVPPGAEEPITWNLKNSMIFITYEDPPDDTNLLVPTVSIVWEDLTGRVVRDTLTTALTDR